MQMTSYLNYQPIDRLMMLVSIFSSRFLLLSLLVFDLHVVSVAVSTSSSSPSFTLLSQTADPNSTFNNLAAFPYTLDTGETLAVLGYTEPGPVPSAFLNHSELVFNLAKPAPWNISYPYTHDYGNFSEIFIEAGLPGTIGMYLDEESHLKYDYSSWSGWFGTSSQLLRLRIFDDHL